MKLLAIVVLTFAFVNSANAGFGVDVNSPVSQQNWQCIKVQTGASVAFVRIYGNNGYYDQNAAATIKNAKAAKFDHVTGYIQPCYHCSTNPKQQLLAAITSLEHNHASIDEVWIVVETPSQWDKDTKKNVQFIQAMVQAAKQEGLHVGINTVQQDWKTITGNSNSFNNLPLWYSHIDNQPNFNDYSYQAFGGWKKPTVKQYSGPKAVCGIQLHTDWFLHA